MDRRMRFWTWAHGLVSSAITGGSSSALGWTGFAVGHELGMNIPVLNLQGLGMLFLSGFIGACLQYLKLKPLPPLATEDAARRHTMKKLLLLIPLIGALMIGCATAQKFRDQVVKTATTLVTNDDGTISTNRTTTLDPNVEAAIKAAGAAGAAAGFPWAPIAAGGLLALTGAGLGIVNYLQNRPQKK
jgi:hypothetical protein